MIESKSELLNAYQNESGKNPKFKNGKLKASFLKWNKKKLRNKQTRVYYEDGKLFNPVTNRLVKVKYDKRYKTPTLSASFKKKFNVEQGLAVPINNDVYEFNVYPTGESVGYRREITLENNLLLMYLIADNNIFGDYRIILTGHRDGYKTRLYDASHVIQSANRFWEENKELFQNDSEHMIWNTPSSTQMGELEFERVTFHFTKEKYLSYNYYEQSFRDGLGHCFFEPIKNHFTKTKFSKGYQKRVNATLSKLNNSYYKSGLLKRQGMIEKYDRGIPIKDIPEVCEQLKIDVEIVQPFSSTPLFKYECHTKPLKKFGFINPRLDHVVSTKRTNTMYKNSDFIECSQDELRVIKKLAEENDEVMPIYSRNSFGLQSVKTLNAAYRLKSEFYEAVNKFEKKTGLKYCGIDSLKYPELTKYLSDGTHFNCCVDIKDTEFMRKNKNIPSNMNHMDLEKAYTQFKRYDYYNGFCGKITDFRKVNNFDQPGLYRITDLDMTNSNIKDINDLLGIYKTDNIYPQPDLIYLKKTGATFQVIDGAYGTKIDFEFKGDMLNKKDEIKLQSDDPEPKIVKIPYYSKLAGVWCMDRKKETFYMKGKSSYFQTINTPEDTSIFYNNEDKEAKITYPKKASYHKKHITAYITSYQRLHVIEQLKKMDLSKVYRICTDGIYYEDHHWEGKTRIHDKKCYVDKEKIWQDKSHEMTFKNSPCSVYLSNLIGNNTPSSWDDYEFPNTREFYLRELWNGQGGTGKTYLNVNDRGLINPVYIVHSWNKATEEEDQFIKLQNGQTLAVSVHHRLFHRHKNPELIYQYNNYIIDECSMFTNDNKEVLFQDITQSRLIFLGDPGYQLPPFEGGREMDEKGFDYIKTLTETRRFKCKHLINLANELRECIRLKIKFDLSKWNNKINRLGINELAECYKAEDLILVSCHWLDHEYNRRLSNIEKYKVKQNSTAFKNGQIFYEKIKGVKMEFRHGFTAHSIQGQTHKGRLFIDLTGVYCNRMLYTMISRATKLEHIHFIHKMPFDDATLARKRYQEYKKSKVSKK